MTEDTTCTIRIEKADRETLKELSWQERRTGNPPLTFAEQLSKVLAFYLFAHEAMPQKDK